MVHFRGDKETGTRLIFDVTQVSELLRAAAELFDVAVPLSTPFYAPRKLEVIVFCKMYALGQRSLKYKRITLLYHAECHMLGIVR